MALEPVEKGDTGLSSRTKINAGLTAIDDTVNSSVFVTYPALVSDNITPGSTDMTATIQAAIDATEPGQALMIPAGNYRTSSTLNVTEGITIIAATGAENGTNGTPPQATRAVTFTWAASGGANPMLLWKASTSGQTINHGGISGILFDGSNVASIGIQVSSCQYSVFDVTTYRTVTDGMVIDDGNSALSNGVYLRRFEHFSGGNAAADSANGLRIDGNENGNECTNIVADFVEVENVDGTGVVFRSVDSCKLKRVKVTTRSGGTGYSVSFLKSTVDTTFHAQKNSIDWLVAKGYLYFGDFTKNNQVKGIAEDASLACESTGANQRANHVELYDFRNSAAFATHKFKMNDRLNLPIGALAAYGTTATQTTLGGTAGGTAWSFSASATNGVSYSDMTPIDWNGGAILGVRLMLQSVGSTTGNAVFKVQGLARSNTSAVGSFVQSVTETLTPAQSAGSTMTMHEIRFSTEITSYLDGVFEITIERIGGDAADTFTNAVVLAGVQVLYRGSGPNSTGYTGPFAEIPIGGSDANP